MSAFPDFSRLLKAVESLGVDLTDCMARLAEGVEVTSELDYVAAPDGFYDVLPTGDIVRLIIHIGQGDHMRCHDDPERWHRYHTGKCAAYGPPSRRLKHFKTRRADGRFTYFLHDCRENEYRPEDRIHGRPLTLCGNCRNKLGHLSLLGEHGEPDLAALLAGDLVKRLHLDPIRHDEDRISGFPAGDWHCIAAYVKSRTAWHCARCATDFRDAKRFLHAHYRPSDRHEATLGRVTALCAGCHSLENGHETLRLKVRSAPNFAGFRQLRPSHPCLVS